MFTPRPPTDRIDRYAGPYERWVFSDELGRPYSFPLIAGEMSGLFTALMEQGGQPVSTPAMAVRLPPLWPERDHPRDVTPFVFEDLDVPPDTPDPSPDTRVARMLNAARDRAAGRPRFRVNFPIIPETWVSDYDEGAAPASWSAPATPPKAIIAVIDDGIPFANRAYLDSAGRTRISHLWLQSGKAVSPAHIPFGRELTNAEIDSLRAAHPRDEAELYRQSGAIGADISELGNHLRRAATHGAHIMGLAAGNDTLFQGEALGDDIQIIAVQLPNTIAWDTSGFGKEMYMLSAIHYVFERASRIAQACGVAELPLVVNFSYGWSGGRHDGQSEMEIAIEQLLAERRALQPATALVMPTGNTFGDKMHGRLAEGDFDADQVQIGWHLQPDDRTSSYLEMWFPEEFDPTGYTLSLSLPHGVVPDSGAQIEVSPDPDTPAEDDGDPRRFVELVLGGQIIGQLSVDKHRDNRWRVMVALIPTVYTRGQDRRAPSGDWVLTLSRDASAAVLAPEDDLLIWVQRDDDPSDLKTFGRQSTLVDMGPRDLAAPPKPPLQSMTRDPGPVSGYGALNGVGSSASTTLVAGFVQQNGRPTTYSGAGGLRQQDDGTLIRWGQHADLTAASDQSEFRAGLPSLGVLSGTRARLIGTSCAAPTVARRMVLNAAAGRDLFDGFAGPLALHPTEDPHPNIRVQHAARIGERTAYPLVRGGRDDITELLA